MRALVLGAGGREHALAWALSRSSAVDSLLALPGNPGIAGIAECVVGGSSEPEAVAALAQDRDVGLVVVGPEVPLVAGVVDACRARGILAFGPTQEAATLEGSKAWMKDLLREAGVPTARHAVFTADQEDRALSFLDTLGDLNELSRTGERLMFEHRQLIEDNIRRLRIMLAQITRVVEEAQAVLGSSGHAADGPYVAWVKEGRKYDLGAVLITQQPGSIPSEILSQGDNWFIFHLLSAADLTSLKRANSHFSDDLLTSLLNEPIPGQGVFWSSVGGKPYPVSIRALSFEKSFPVQDATFNKAAAETFATVLRKEFQTIMTQAPAQSSATSDQTKKQTAPDSSHEGSESEAVDVLALYEDRAIDALRNDSDLINKIRVDGVAWGSIKAFLLDELPANLDDRDALAYNLVRKAMDRIFGRQGQDWHTFKHAQRNTTYVKIGRSS